MRRRRPRLVRTAGFLALISLLGLNAWLVALNLDKHDRLPFDASGYPGFGRSGEDGGVVGDGSGDGGPVGDGDGDVEDGSATLLTDDAPVPSSLGPGSAAEGTGAGDTGFWPGGRGPVPFGPPEPRQVLLTVDGELRVTGSAPSWSVVTELAGSLAGRSGVGPLGVEVDEVTWHPEASVELGDGVARLERPLLYDAGEVGLPAEGPSLLSPVVDLLGDRSALYVVLVAHVDDLGDSEANAAVALARVSAVADALVGLGVEESRVVTAVAPPDPEAPVGGDEATRRFNRRVDVRIENLLLPTPTG